MSDVKVELHAVPQGANNYEVVADLVVRTDGSYELNDPDGYMPSLDDFPVLVVSDQPGLHRVYFAENPQLWARSLPNSLRTGYLVPVVTELDAD